MATRGAVQLALAVKSGEMKLEELSKSARKKVNFVLESGAISHMTGKEKSVGLPHQFVSARPRRGRVA